MNGLGCGLQPKSERGLRKALAPPRGEQGDCTKKCSAEEPGRILFTRLGPPLCMPRLLPLR